MSLFWLGGRHDDLLRRSVIQVLELPELVRLPLQFGHTLLCLRGFPFPTAPSLRSRRVAALWERRANSHPLLLLLISSLRPLFLLFMLLQQRRGGFQVPRRGATPHAGSLHCSHKCGATGHGTHSSSGSLPGAMSPSAYVAPPTRAPCPTLTWACLPRCGHTGTAMQTSGIVPGRRA